MIREKLDFSPESLLIVEKYILDTYDSMDAILADDQSEALNGLSIYVGQTFRKNLGGIWTIDFEDEDDADYGLPIISGFGEYEESTAPLTLVTASLDRRQSDYLMSIFEANRPDS